MLEICAEFARMVLVNTVQNLFGQHLRSTLLLWVLLQHTDPLLFIIYSFRAQSDYWTLMLSVCVWGDEGGKRGRGGRNIAAQSRILALIFSAAPSPPSACMEGEEKNLNPLESILNSPFQRGNRWGGGRTKEAESGGRECAAECRMGAAGQGGPWTVVETQTAGGEGKAEEGRSRGKDSITQ